MRCSKDRSGKRGVSQAATESVAQVRSRYPRRRRKVEVSGLQVDGAVSVCWKK